MSNYKFQGVWTINPIPFTDNDDVNEEEYKRHVEFMIQGGINGIMPVGTVANGIQLSHSERLRVIQLTVEQANGRVPVFPCCYIPAGTKNTIEFMNEIEKLGADGAYLPTPILWQCGPTAIYEHYRSIIEETLLPVICYSAELTTGTSLPSDVVFRLLDEFPGRILGYKQQILDELPFDMVRLGDRINLAPPCLDRYIMAGLELGCKAQTSIGGALVPEVLSAIFEMWETGDKLGARKLFYMYFPLFELPPKQYIRQHRDYYAGSYMYMLNRMGFRFGKPRLPYLWPLPEALCTDINEVLENLKLIGGCRE